MRRLVVNPGTAQAWAIQLKPGINLLGRDPTNDFPIQDSSVSGCHCQIEVTDDRVVLTDLASTNGTFVNQTPIREAQLELGQTIRLGRVEMVFSDAEPAVAQAGPVRIPSQPRASATTTCLVHPAAIGPTFCKFHPKSPARYQCDQCHRTFCELCVNTRSAPAGAKHTCRACGVECRTLPAGAWLQPEPVLTFAHCLRGAFAYPLKGDGIILLVAGGIFLLLLDGAAFVARFAFTYGKVALVFITVLGTGYFVSYLRRILTSSASGESRMPDWPEITDFADDVLQPFLQFVGTVAFSFGPAIALGVCLLLRVDFTESSWVGPLLIGSILFGCIYFPMAFTAVALLDSVLAVNPLLVVPSILKIPLAYSVTILLFTIIPTLSWLSDRYLPLILPIGLPWVLSGFIGLYLATVEMRILGVLYWTKKGELGWFSR